MSSINPGPDSCSFPASSSGELIVSDSANAEPAFVRPFALELEHLSWTWPDGRVALSDVSFSIADGERVALIGPNGAGKSTLIQHLNGLLPGHFPRGGKRTVRVFGCPVEPASFDSVRRDVGVVFQDPDDQLFCETVFEDVAFGPRQFLPDRGDRQSNGVDARVHEALARAGLQGFEERSVDRLSRGEKRRVAIAGVLACEPRLLVLDEPTSDLDPRGKRELLALLKTLPIAHLLVSHDLEWARALCTRAILLDAGRVITDGPIDTLLANEPLMLAHGLECPPSLACKKDRPE
ncbi:MAG: ABC transporter ATP-binding protein [Candidatus Riflebacteria bacterium]|nr:ABC transporter ATP-binding protein [Candidatus Riflebacteria bacterium]